MSFQQQEGQVPLTPVRPRLTRITDEDFVVALTGDSMWQRAMARRASRQIELVFFMIDGSENRGFISGLDKEWVQLTLTETQKAVWLNLVAISRIIETGRGLRELEVSEDAKERIRSFTRTFRNKSRSLLKDERDEREIRED